MHVAIASSLVRPEAIAHLKQIGGDKATVVDTEPALVEALKTVDGLVCSDNAYTPAVAEAVRRAPNLRWMQLLNAGYDNTGRLGIPDGLILCNVGDAFSPSVAVHAVGLLMALQRGVPALIARQREHKWDRAVTNHMTMPSGGTLLIVGYGSIGREIARLMAPLGMRVVGVSRSGRDDPKAPGPRADEMHKISDLASLLPRADAVVLSLPLGPTTTGLIGAKELALCKRTALLINISRGLVVDTPALVAALHAGTIGGAGLDVTEPEPLPADQPLWDAPNLIISPHIAGAAGPDGVARLSDRAGANLQRYLAGEPVQHVVTM